jgi:hypothetical protein
VFECDFSTSTDVDRVAARIILLDAYSPYFALWMVAVCGITSVTLTGTVEDWQKIRARIDPIADLGLQTWCRSVAPIGDQCVRAASGDADTAFWQRIYNPADAYGGKKITGWVTRLYRYLLGDGVVDVPNRMLELPLGEPRDLTLDRRGYSGPGIRSGSVPATVVGRRQHQRPGPARQRAVALHAGLVGVAQGVTTVP